MARKKISSYADLIESVSAIIKGLKSSGNKDENNRATALHALLTPIQKLHKDHDAATAVVLNISKQLDPLITNLKTEKGKAVSFLESKDGATSPLLLNYGIEPRHKGGKKGPHQPKTTTKS